MSKKTPEQASANSSRIKVMKECLRIVAQIRRELTGRAYSNSTDLATEDRRR